MKTLFALATLSTKTIMLLCVSCMGLFGVVEDVFAASGSPCHQEIMQNESAGGPCEICQTALEAWDKNAIFVSDGTLVKISDFLPSGDLIAQNFEFSLKPLSGVYERYYPPPEVIFKSVTPNTNTIVLIV